MYVCMYVCMYGRQKVNVSLIQKLPTTTNIRKLVHKLRTGTSEPMSTATFNLETTHT